MSEHDEIKERVKAAAHIEDWVRRDCPDLKGGPVEFKAKCPFHEERTPSFTVNADKGIFHCFGCGENGDVFDWVMRRRGVDFPTALRMIANDVGIAVGVGSGGSGLGSGAKTGAQGTARPTSGGRIYQPKEVREAAEPIRGAFDPDKYRALVPGGKVFRYLTEKRRLTPEILQAYSVGETADGEAYSFAYKWWPGGMERKAGHRPRFEFCKVVKVDRADGKKIEWRDPKGGKNILFGMCAIPDEARELVIAEGEIDAMTWAQYGFPAVSVPGGAGYTGWINITFDWLARFQKIYVSFDEDRAGRQKLVEVVTRLGIARTDIVRLPEKASDISTAEYAEHTDGNVALSGVARKL